MTVKSKSTQEAPLEDTENTVVASKDNAKMSAKTTVKEAVKESLKTKPSKPKQSKTKKVESPTETSAVRSKRTPKKRAPVDKVKPAKPAKAKKTSETPAETPAAVEGETAPVESETSVVPELLPKAKKVRNPKPINDKDTRADTIGLNLAVSRVDNIMRNYVMNSDEIYAMRAIAQAKGGDICNQYDPKKEEKMLERGFEVKMMPTKNGEKKKFYKYVKPKPLKALADPKFDAILQRCKDAFITSKKLEYAKGVMRKLKEQHELEELEMSDEEKLKHRQTSKYETYKKALAAAKNQHLEKNPGDDFDEVKFFLSLDSSFFDGFTEEKSEKDEYDQAKEWVRKCKLQVSKHVKVYLIAFVEFVIC